MIKIIKIKENKDGSADITFTYGKKFKEFLKTSYNLKKVTKKDVDKFVKEAIIYAIKRDETTYNSGKCVRCSKCVCKTDTYCSSCAGEITVVSIDTRKKRKRRK